MAIYFVSFPIKNGGSFQFVMLARLPGRVTYQLGFPHDFPHDFPNGNRNGQGTSQHPAPSQRLTGLPRHRGDTPLK